MKKMLAIGMLLIIVFLTGCAQTTVTCGEGTKLEDGFCVVDDDVKSPIEEPQDPNDTIDTPTGEICQMDIEEYAVTNYEMVWNDEFETDGMLDPLKWEYLIGNGSDYGIPGWGNNELQYYTNDEKNVNIADGILTITATTEGYSSYGYTSGRVRTKDLGDFQYGIVEVCAIMPGTLGTWPAIWMLPTDSPYGGWPNGGEIDIMEAVGFETDTVHFNIHTKNDNWGTSRSIGAYSNINNIATEYHRYGVKWLEDEIIFYVDGIEQFSYIPVADSFEYWPFDSEFHLLLNIAVGGAWGGQRGILDGDWDDSMYVDYVRVYQEK